MKRILSLSIALFLMWGCSQEPHSTEDEPHFIQDKNYRVQVEKRFAERQELAKNRQHELFDVFQENLNIQEKEALQFLYAYMPLNDLADYKGDFFLKQVRTAFEARNTFSWGKEIPEAIFRHFVLPYRINNENLDSARWVFFEELKPRLQGLSMHDAALEVNHWCHEKVNYSPSDMRTSSPLSTLRTAWGRCGEESTFTVTAMRAVGIPARQVYTPRWAHCDDNHAWVEVYTDGKWSYLGACEPEPELNIGWFTEPARRAMIVHTKVFGNYQGTDEVVKRSDNFTEINVVKNYADTQKIYVQVLDKDGQAAEGARVDFGLYNYAEFYPIVKKYSDEQGLVSLTTGLGDLLITASKDGQFSNQKRSASLSDTLILKLGDGFTKPIAQINFTPPIEPEPFIIDETKKQANQNRLDQEDAIRNSYKATFMDSITAYEIANKLEQNPQLTWEIFKKSEGNWVTIQRFIKESNRTESKQLAYDLLNTIAVKDLRDTKSDILLDHLNNTYQQYTPDNYASADIYLKYVLNPRIANENLIAYRAYLQNKFSNQFQGERTNQVNEIKDWISKQIQINDAENYYNLPITPIGVHELKIANKQSRDIFFVALSRSLGIPARLEPTQKFPQYYNGENWVTIYFEKQTNEQAINGFLRLNADSIDFDPKYYSHFTIGKLNNGVYNTLDYDWDSKLSELPSPLVLETGDYRLITGKRSLDGTVYTYINHFKIAADQTQELDLIFRNPTYGKEILGQINPASTFSDKKDNLVKLSDLNSQKTRIICFIEYGKEPTKHFYEELKANKANYENWGGDIVLLTANNNIRNDAGISSEKENNSFTFFQEGSDPNNELLDQLKSELKIKSSIQKPWILLINPAGNIMMSSQAYKIGIHDHILNQVKDDQP